MIIYRCVCVNVFVSVNVYALGVKDIHTILLYCEYQNTWKVTDTSLNYIVSVIMRNMRTNPVTLVAFVFVYPNQT